MGATCPGHCRGWRPCGGHLRPLGGLPESQHEVPRGGQRLHWRRDDSALVGGGAGTGRRSFQQAGPLSRWHGGTAAILGTWGAEPEGTLCFCDVTDGQTDGPPSTAGPARSPAGSGCKRGVWGHVPSRLGPDSRGRLSPPRPLLAAAPSRTPPGLGADFILGSQRQGESSENKVGSPVQWKVFPSVLSPGHVEVGGLCGRVKSLQGKAGLWAGGKDRKERGMEREAWELGPCASADAEDLCPARKPGDG